MIGPKLRQHLIAYDSLNQLISGRVYPVKLPQKDPKELFPCVSYYQSSGGKHHDIPVAYPIYTFDSWSNRYGEAKQVAAEVTNALQRFKGDMFGVDVIQGVYEREEDMQNEELGIYQIPVDIKIIHYEE